MYLAFNHIPKCAGNSINNVLQTWGDVIFDYSLEIQKIKKIHTNQILCGHFLPHKYPSLLTISDISVFSFIRDPLSMIISLYYYHRNRNRLLHLPLNDYILNMSQKYPNYLSTCIGCNQNNYKNIIDQYFFIGIYENLQESFDIFCQLAKQKTTVLPRNNVSTKDNQVVTQKVKELFLNKNNLSYCIYHYCKERYIYSS